MDDDDQHHDHLRFTSVFTVLARFRRFPKMPLLHTSRSSASSLLSFNFFKSSLTHSSDVFRPLPDSLCPTPTHFRHDETKSPTSLCSTCPNHLSLPHLTTSAIPSIPKRWSSS